MPNTKALSALAINGGRQFITSPLPARHHFGEAEKAAANRIYDAAIAAGVAPGYGGPEEEAFCKEFAAMVGGGYADAISSGSDSVFVAIRALEIEPFTEIVTGPITDPGGLMPIVMNNCIPVIADAAPLSFNISVETVSKVVTERTSCIVVPHIAGEPADIEGIVNFAHARGIKVVEDAAQAHGAMQYGRFIGTVGDVGAFSMMFGKHTCMGGQGGVVYSKTEELYWKIRQNSDRGKPFGLPAGSTNCVATLNFNADEVACAIGREQIKKTMAIAEGRRRVVDIIQRELADTPCVSFSKPVDGAIPSYWFLRVIFNPETVTCTKHEFCDALRAESNTLNVAENYPATPFTYDWYKNRKVYGTSGYPWAAPSYTGDREKRYTIDDCPNAKEALERTFQLYPFESWSDADAVAVAGAIKKVYEAYKK